MKKNRLFAPSAKKMTLMLSAMSVSEASAGTVQGLLSVETFIWARKTSTNALNAS